eukprot:1395415-Amphidinium_carterae.1
MSLCLNMLSYVATPQLEGARPVPSALACPDDTIESAKVVLNANGPRRKTSGKGKGKRSNRSANVTPCLEEKLEREPCVNAAQLVELVQDIHAGSNQLLDAAGASHAVGEMSLPIGEPDRAHVFQGQLCVAHTFLGEQGLAQQGGQDVGELLQGELGAVEVSQGELGEAVVLQAEPDVVEVSQNSLRVALQGELGAAEVLCGELGALDMHTEVGAVE